MNSKIIIFSAPSGSGKSTIIRHLLQEADLNLAFSISTTSRAPRGAEKDGVEYYYRRRFQEKNSRECLCGMAGSICWKLSWYLSE